MNKISLTARELEYLALLAKGLGNREVARHMGRSFHTVRMMYHRMFKKMGVKNRVQAAVVYVTQYQEKTDG